jgi:hypothetical protein
VNRKAVSSSIGNSKFIPPYDTVKKKGKFRKEWEHGNLFTKRDFLKGRNIFSYTVCYHINFPTYSGFEPDKFKHYANFFYQFYQAISALTIQRTMLRQFSFLTSSINLSTISLIIINSSVNSIRLFHESIICFFSVNVNLLLKVVIGTTGGRIEH